MSAGAGTRGTFLTIEGLDCTGKTTLVERVKRDVLQEGLDVYFTADPPNSSPWDLIKREYLDKRAMSDPGKAFVFLAARVEETVSNILPRLSAGTAVVSDRYSDSWIAYQAPRLMDHLGVDLEDALDLLEGIQNRLVDSSLLAVPDQTFFLRDTVERIMERMRREGERRSQHASYEDKSTQRATEGAYAAILERHPDRFRVFDIDSVDLREPIRQVSDAVLSTLRGNVGDPGG